MANTNIYNPADLQDFLAQASDLSARFHLVTVQTKMPSMSYTIKGLVQSLEAQAGAAVGESLRETGALMWDEKHSFWTRIKKSVNAVRAQHNKLTSIWDGTGWRLLSTAKWKEYGTTMFPLISHFNQIADEAIDLFPDFMREAEGRLVGLFDRGRYPDDAQDFRSRFSIRTPNQTIPKLEDAKRLSTVLPVAEIEEMERDIRQSFQDNLARINAKNWEILHEQASRLRDALVNWSTIDPVTGQRGQKSVKQTLLDVLEKNCQYCTEFNVSNDPRLAMLIEDIRNSVLSVDMDQIRQSDVVLNTVIQSATSARDQAMAQMRKMRGITGTTLQ